MSAALQYFEENLPHRPYHTDDLAFGLRISGKGRALLARYIQQNQPHAQFWLVFDVDREGAAIDWSDRNAPAPNITVKNPVNGHAHLLYALNIAVGKSIAKYTHRNFTPETFAQYVADTHTPEIQAARGRKGGSKSKRSTVATSARTLKPWEALEISRAWYYQLKKRGLVE